MSDKSRPCVTCGRFIGGTVVQTDDGPTHDSGELLAERDHLREDYSACCAEKERVVHVLHDAFDEKHVAYLALEAEVARLREENLEQERRLFKFRAALRKTHGTAQAMADLDSWIAQECGMADDGENWYVPEARAALAQEEE